MKKQKTIDENKEIDIDNKGLLFYANEEPQEKLFNFLMSMDKLKNTRIVSSLIDADIINEPEIIEQICIKHFLKENKFTFSKNQEIYNCVAKKYNNVFEKKEDTEKFFEKIKQYLTTTCYQKYENDEDFFTSVLSDQYLEIKARIETNEKIKKFNELGKKIKKNQEKIDSIANKDEEILKKIQENKEKINKNLDNIKILENYINILENNNNTLLKEVLDENNIKIEDIKNILKIKKIDDEIEELIKMKQIWKQQQDAKDIDTEQNIYYFNKKIKLLTEEKLSYIKYINSKMLDLIDINKEEINIDNQEITINIEKFKEFINNIKKQINKKIEDKISTKKQKHEGKEKYIKSNNLLNQIILHRKNEWNFEEKIKDVIINIYKDIYVYGIENDKDNNKITLHQYDNKNEINKDVTEEINNIVKKIINDITSYRQKIEKEKKENNKQIDKKTIEKEEEKIIKNIIDNIYKEKDEIYCNEYYKIVEIEKINLLKNYNDIYNQVIENQKEIKKGLVKNFDVYKKQTIEDYIKYRIKNDKNIEEINNEVGDNALEEKLNKQKQEISDFFDVLNKTITDELFTLKKDNKEQTKEKIEEFYNIRQKIENLNKLNKYKKEFNQNEYDIQKTKDNEKKKKLEKRNKHIQEIVVILLKKDPEKDDITKIFDEINTEKNNKDKKELSLKLREYEQLLNKQDEIDCLRHYNRQLEEEKDNIKLENKEIKKINEENEKLKKEQQDLNVKDVDGKVLNYGQPYNITADEQNFYNYCDTKYKETIKELKNNVSVNSTSKVYEKIDEKIGKEIIKNIKNKMKFLNNGEKKFNKEENKDLQIFLYQLFGALQNAKVKEYYTIEDFSRNSNDDKHYLETQYNNGVDIEFADIMELSQHVSRCATNCHTSFNDFSKMRKTKDKIDNTDNNILNCIDGNNYLYKEPYYMNKKHSFLTAEYHYKNVAKNNVVIAQNVIKNKNKKPVFIVPGIYFWAGDNFANIYPEVVFNYYQEIKNTFNDDFTIYFRDGILKGLNNKYVYLYKALKKLINFKKNISTKYSEYEQKNIEEELKNKCKNIFDQIHKDTYIYISEKEQNSLDDKFNKIIQKYLNKDSFTLEDIQLEELIKNPIDKQIMNLFKDNNKDNYKEEYINFLNQIDKKIIFVNHKESTKIPFNNDKQEVFLLFAGDFGTICGNDCLTTKRLTTSDEVIIMRTDYVVIMQPNEIRKQLFNKFIDAKEDSGINGAIYCLCKNDIDGKRILPPKEWWIDLNEIFYIDRFDKKRYNLGENWKEISKKIENKFNKNNNKNSKIDYLFIPKIIDNKEPINTNLNKEKQIEI